MDDDVCHDRRCWASVNGHFTGDVLEGGRVDATTWPVQPQQAIDVWFNKSTDPDIGTWDAGYWRTLVIKFRLVIAFSRVDSHLLLAIP